MFFWSKYIFCNGTSVSLQTKSVEGKEELVGKESQSQRKRGAGLVEKRGRGRKIGEGNRGE